MTAAVLIQLVILDWFGVVNSELTSLFHQTFGTSPEQQAYIKASNDQADAGAIDVQEVYQAYAKVMSEQTGQAHDSAQAKAWLNAHSGVDWTLVALVQQIRQHGVKVVVGSNAASDHRNNLVDAGMLQYFDEVYVSSDMGSGIKKPSAAFFEHILLEQGIAPSNALFIDDAEGHVRGARAVGVYAEQYGLWGDLEVARRIFDQYGLI